MMDGLGCNFMKKVLYLTNIEVPYRVRFFNELAKHCDLTVLYESRGSASRNREWAKSAETLHNVKYLQEKRIGKFQMDISGILREISAGYDVIIVGCYNSPVQMLSILAMNLRRIPYIINLDGEAFLEGNSLKAKIKRFFLSGAEKYLVAGEKSAQSVKQVVGNKDVIPYYFSSLTEKEIADNREMVGNCSRNESILVVCQYLKVKGLDVVLDAAWVDASLHYKIVGTGLQTEQFVKENIIPENVEVIPFLQKSELEKEYQTCAMLVLPSRQECWGLVINEAASFGMPIVSTWGSGAAVEFLADEYPQYLAKPGYAESLLDCIRKCMHADNGEYRNYLLQKSGEYSIERSVREHMRVF